MTIAKFETPTIDDGYMTVSVIFDNQERLVCIGKDTPAFRNFLERTINRQVLSKQEIDYFYSKTVRFTMDGKQLIDGQMLFDNMDSKGIALDIALIQCDLLTDGNFAVDWTRFIDRAIERNWLVYQIHDRMKHAMNESDLFGPSYISSVMHRFMVHVCKTVPEFQQYLKD